MGNKIKTIFLRGAKYCIPIALIVALAIAFMPSITMDFFDKELTLGFEGDPVHAATADYLCDGIDDHLQWQAALDALPSGGGRLVGLAGDYNFGATVSRAIDNVKIDGMGYSTYFANDGGTALFSAGAQDRWQFNNLRTDAGGITISSAIDWTMENTWLGATFYAMRVDDSIQGEHFRIPTGRAGVVFVAASDATDVEIAQADTLCDGINDGLTIEAACALAAANYGKVLLSSGTFLIDDGDVAINKATVEGQGQTNISVFGDGGTILELGGNSDYVWLKEDGRLWSVTIKKPTGGFTGKALYIAGDMVGGTVNAIRDRALNVVKDIQVTGGQSDEVDMTGTGILIEVENGVTFKNYMELCSMNDISVQGFNIGIKIVVTRDTGDASNSFWNGNVMHNVFITSCAYPCELEINGALSPELQGNVFSNWIINACTGMIDGITLDDNSTGGNIWRNMWTSFFFWDEGELSGNGLVADNNSQYNSVLGKTLAGWIQTNGADWNTVTEITSSQYSSYISIPPYNWTTGSHSVGFSGKYFSAICGNTTIESGELCYRASNEKMYITDADAYATTDGQLGIALEDGSADDIMHFMSEGYLRLGGEAGWTTPGEKLWISTTPGDITPTRPNANGDFNRIVGWTTDYAGNQMFFHFDNDVYELDAAGINKINGVAISP